jgi:hypothetical protein
MPKGGMHDISQSVYKLALDLGVKFHFGNKVDEIILENKIARIFKTNEFICLFCDDYDIMINLIKNFCKIKNMNAIKKYCIDFMNKTNVNNQNFMLHLAIYIEPHYFTDLPMKIRDDEPTIYLATKINPKALHYSTLRIKNNRNFVTNLFNENTDCYEFVGTIIKKDIEITKMALLMNKNNIKYVSNELLQDKNFILYAYSLECKGIYERIQNDLLYDYDIIINAIKNDDNIDMILLQNKDYRCDEKIIKLAIEYSSNSNILRYAAQNIKNDENICYLAIMKNIEAIQYVSDDLKNNYKFLKNILCSVNFGLHEEMVFIFSESKSNIKIIKCEECKKNKEENDLGCNLCIGKLKFILKECQNDRITNEITKSNYEKILS